MKRIHCTQDVLDIAARLACSAALSRACGNGTHTTPRRSTLPWGNIGLTFQVVSQSGSSRWAVCVEIREAERSYRVHSRKVD